jgi:hypothetical protein
MPKTASKPEMTVSDAMERLRQVAIEARNSADVATEAQEAVDQLNGLYAKDKDAFTPEDVRFANVLRGALGARLAAHGPKVVHTKKAKRKGDKLDHCWRCQTPIDERFTDNCPQCSEKAYQWRLCPVCQACGCQRAGKVLI